MSITEERKNLYASTRADLLNRQISNSENFDKAILSLSTGLLGLSLAFIKDIVKFDNADLKFILVLSWYCLAFSIISTIMSFITSQLGIKKQLVFAEKYYLEKNDDYLTKENTPAKITDFLNYSSGIVFVLAIFLTIIFVSTNLMGGAKMSGNKNNSTESALNKAMSIPSMQRVSTSIEGTRGATIPNMQPVSTSQPGSQTGTSGTSEGSANTNSSGNASAER